MADEYLNAVDFPDIDLNQEPSNQPLNRIERYESLLNELETAQDRIQEIIRRATRTWLRNQLRQARNSTETSSFTSETMVDVGQRSTPNVNNVVSVFNSSERGKGCKRDSSHLVAKALEEMDYEVKKSDKEGGSFYDCNICLEVAKEPVLTCCGHLFSWPCFYQVSGIDSTSKGCPVCKGEVSDSTVIPIYGNGDSERVFETESGLMIPLRPKARRVQSVRQELVNQGLFPIPITEAIMRFRTGVGAVDNQTRQEGGSVVLNFDSESQAGQSDRLRRTLMSRTIEWDSVIPRELIRRRVSSRRRLN